MNSKFDHEMEGCPSIGSKIVMATSRVLTNLSINCSEYFEDRLNALHPIQFLWTMVFFSASLVTWFLLLG
jgi:hypothetical protein